MKNQTLLAIAASTLGLAAFATATVVQSQPSDTKLVPVIGKMAIDPVVPFGNISSEDQPNGDQLAGPRGNAGSPQVGPGGRQGNGGQERGPGGGPMGGPGGGMRAPVEMLRDPKVVEELHLTQQQLGQIHDGLSQIRPNGGPGGGPGGQNGGPGGQTQGQGGPGRGGPGGEDMGAKVDEVLKGVMSSAQFKRYKELECQYVGPPIVLSPAISELLQLSQAQREKIISIIQEGRPPMAPGGQGGPGQGGPGSGEGRNQGGPGQGGPGPDPQQMRKHREEIDAKILAVLTSEQRNQWKQLIGAKFEFGPPPPPPTPPGGPGGPGLPGGVGGPDGGGEPSQGSTQPQSEPLN